MGECDSIEICCSASLACLCLGIIFTSLTLVVDVNYKVDPNLTAREMEGVERYYNNLRTMLYLSAVIGLGLIATGSALLLLAIIVMALNGELFCCLSDDSQLSDVESCGNCGNSNDENKQNLPLLNDKQRTNAQQRNGCHVDYGSYDQRVNKQHPADNNCHNNNRNHNSSNDGNSSNDNSSNNSNQNSSNDNEKHLNINIDDPCNKVANNITQLSSNDNNIHNISNIKDNKITDINKTF